MSLCEQFQFDESYFNKALSFLKQTIVYPSSQEIYNEFLLLAQDAHFLQSLFLFLTLPSIDIDVRTQSCILIRKILNIAVIDENLLSLVLNSNFRDRIVYVFEVEPCLFVRQVASLLAAMCFKFGIDVFPNISDYLNQIIDNFNIAENALIFASEYIEEAQSAGKCISFGEKFAKSICNFVGIKQNRIGAKALKIINYLTFLFMDYYREALIPQLFSRFEQFDEEEQRYIVSIVGNFLKNINYVGDHELVDFAISCISSQYESVGITAAEIFEYCQMIPFNERCLFELFVQSGSNFDLIQYNLSNQCLTTIKEIYGLYNDNVIQFLMPKIQEALLSQNEDLIRCGLRCFAIIIPKIENIDEIFNFIVPLLKTTLVCDASYCLSSLSKIYKQFKYQVIELLFNSLQDENFNSEIRCSIEKNISTLLEGVKLPVEPFLSIILKLFNKIEDIELNSLLYLLGEFLGVIEDIQDQESLCTLFQIASNLFKSNDSMFIASFHIFGNLLSKNQELFIQIINDVSEKAIECLDAENNDIILIVWILHFYQQAIFVSNNFEISIEEILEKVTTRVVQLIQNENNFEIKKAGWNFIGYLKCSYLNLFVKFSQCFLNIISQTVPSNESIEVIGIITSLFSFYIDVLGKEFVNVNEQLIIPFLITGLQYPIEDNNMYKKEIAKCAAKFYIFSQNSLSSEIYQDIMQIFTYMNTEEKEIFRNYLTALYEKYFK